MLAKPETIGKGRLGPGALLGSMAPGLSGLSVQSS